MADLAAFVLKLMLACSAAVGAVGFFGLRPLALAAALPFVLVGVRFLAVL